MNIKRTNIATIVHKIFSNNIDELVSFNRNCNLLNKLISIYETKWYLTFKLISLIIRYITLNLINNK